MWRHEDFWSSSASQVGGINEPQVLLEILAQKRRLKALWRTSSNNFGLHVHESIGECNLNSHVHTYVNMYIHVSRKLAVLNVNYCFTGFVLTICLQKKCFVFCRKVQIYYCSLWHSLPCQGFLVKCRNFTYIKGNLLCSISLKMLYWVCGETVINKTNFCPYKGYN